MWLDFPLTVLLTVPDFMGGVLLTVLRCWIQHCEAGTVTVLLLAARRSRKNDAGERKHPKISLRDTGRAQTDHHSVLCIVMQRAENVPDAFFENISFCGFCARIALSAF
ncbi:hypothetical protein K5Y72_004243 [Escherichia coli]|nr:hypothetical protein [Escherichia coli]EIM2935364.1 hypothetical protein [Escherichia coli]